MALHLQYTALGGEGQGQGGGGGALAIREATALADLAKGIKTKTWAGGPS